MLFKSIPCLSLYFSLCYRYFTKLKKYGEEKKENKKTLPVFAIPSSG
jgi:hypothetical protein